MLKCTNKCCWVISVLCSCSSHCFKPAAMGFSFTRRALLRWYYCSEYHSAKHWYKSLAASPSLLLKLYQSYIVYNNHRFNRLEKNLGNLPWQALFFSSFQWKMNVVTFQRNCNGRNCNGRNRDKASSAAQDTLQLESQPLRVLESVRWIPRWSVADKWSSWVNSG